MSREGDHVTVITLTLWAAERSEPDSLLGSPRFVALFGLVFIEIYPRAIGDP